MILMKPNYKTSMVTYHFFCCFELSNKFLYMKQNGPILSVEQDTLVGNVNLVSNRHNNHGAMTRIYCRYKQGAVALNKHRDPSFFL